MEKTNFRFTFLQGGITQDGQSPLSPNFTSQLEYFRQWEYRLYQLAGEQFAARLYGDIQEKGLHIEVIRVYKNERCSQL